MSEPTSPLLGRSAPSNFWSNVALGTIAVGGTAATGHQIYTVNEGKGSWTGVVGSLLSLVACAVGYYATRTWSVWHQSQNSQTDTVAKVMGHVQTPLKDRLLPLIKALDARIDELFVQQSEEKNQEADAADIHAIDIPAPIDLTPEQLLGKMQGKIERLIELSAGRSVKFEAVQRELGLLRGQLQQLEPPKQSGHDRAASNVLDQLGSLEALLSGLKPNASFSSSAGNSPDVSPVKPAAHGRLQISVLPPQVDEAGDGTDD